MGLVSLKEAIYEFRIIKPFKLGTSKKQCKAPSFFLIIELSERRDENTYVKGASTVAKRGGFSVRKILVRAS